MIDSRARNVSICDCLHHGPILTQHITVNASRTPLRVSEVLHESWTRTAKSYPDTPIALPRGGRITPIIYVAGDWAESKLFPLREIARFVQGIALYKLNRLSRNSREV